MKDISPQLRKRTRPGYLILYVVLAFLLSWAILIPEALGSAGLFDIRLPPIALALAGFGPALAAVITSWVETGPRGLRSLLRRLLIVRLPWRWYLIALLGPAIILLVGRGLEQVLGGGVTPVDQPPLQAEMGLSHVPVIVFLFGLLANNLIITLGEELGWRGFALPRLQFFWAPLTSGIVLGFLWGVWHLPLVWTPASRSAVAELPLWAFIIDITATSVLYVWIFNHTRGSVAIATLVHAANNTASVFLMPAGAINSRQFFLTIGVRLTAVALVLVLDGGAFAGEGRTTRESSAREL